MSIQRPNEIWNLTLPVQTHWDDLPGVRLSRTQMIPFSPRSKCLRSKRFGSPALTATESKASSSNLPTSTQPKVSRKFLIHGGPQGAWGDDWSYRWNPELFAAPTSSGPGYVVIMINFHGSTGYGQKFIDAINGDWAALRLKT